MQSASLFVPVYVSVCHVSLWPKTASVSLFVHVYVFICLSCFALAKNCVCVSPCVCLYLSVVFRSGQKLGLCLCLSMCMSLSVCHVSLWPKTGSVSLFVPVYVSICLSCFALAKNCICVSICPCLYLSVMFRSSQKLRLCLCPCVSLYLSVMFYSGQKLRLCLRLSRCKSLSVMFRSGQKLRLCLCLSLCMSLSVCHVSLWPKTSTFKNKDQIIRITHPLSSPL